MKPGLFFTISVLLSSIAYLQTSESALILEAGGANLANAQIINFTENSTITGGVLGDATLIESGLVTTVINTDGNGARVTSSGVAGNTFTLSTAPGGGGNVDPSATLFTDNTFTSSAGSPPVDQDDGPGAFEEYRPGDSATINGAGEINLQYNEVAGPDGDVSITFGYDLLDITNRTHNTDFFRVQNLEAGTTLDIEVLASTSGQFYGFFDARLNLFDSSGGSLASVDGDGGFGFLEDTSITVPGDGVVVVEVSHSGDPAARAGGTYHLQLDGTAVPEPSAAVLGILAIFGLLIRRR